MSNGYKVIITGINEEKNRSEVMSALARLFKKPPELLDKKIQAPPWVVKSGLSLPEAEKYKQVLEKAGTVCRIEGEEVQLSMERPEPPEPPKAPEPAQAAGPLPKKTCPKCGYQAFDDNDPLITAFNGKGECPSCGIMVERYLRKIAPPPPTQEDPSATPIQAGSHRGSPIKIIAIAAVVVIAVALGWYFLGGKEAPPKTSTPKTPVKTAESAGTAEESESPRCVINPGNPQTITLSGLAPFFHESHQTGEIDPIMRISQNPWEDRGVEVKVASVKLTPVQVELWEVGHGGGFYTLPNFPKEEIKYIKNKGPGPKTSFIASVIYSDDVRKYVEIGKLSESGFQELVADQKVTDARQSTYTVYNIDINLTFSAPNGVADFSSEMGSRSGYIWVMLTGILTKNGNETGGVDYQYGMKLRGHQNVGENSMTVGLPEDNEYMLSNFSVGCR